jgi:hypothetical protein
MERSDRAPKRVSVPKSARKDRNLRRSGLRGRPALTAVFPGIPRLLERFCSTTENRGVPGSSPGLAIATTRVVARFFSFSVCTAERRIARLNGRRRETARQPRRAAVRSALENPHEHVVPGPTRTEATTTSPSWCSPFDAVTSATAATANSGRPSRCQSHPRDLRLRNRRCAAQAGTRCRSSAS